MAVKFRNFSGGDVLQTTFTDSFTRADKSTWGSNWIRTLENAPGGGGNGATASAQVSTNRGLMTTVAGAAPSQNYLPAWIPLPVYSSLYNKTGVFVQARFQVDGGAGSAGLILRYNHDVNNTITQVEGPDLYMCLMKGAAAGRIDKVVGGGGAATIGAATFGALTLGDLIRFECLTVGATVQLQVMRGASILQTITDSAATAILNGGSAIGWFSISATAQTLSITDFSTGPISALST